MLQQQCGGVFYQLKFGFYTYMKSIDYKIASFIQGITPKLKKPFIFEWFNITFSFIDFIYEYE